MTIDAPTLDQARANLDLLANDQTLDRLITPAIEAGTALANRYAPDAPAAVGKQAILRFVAYAVVGYQTPTGANSIWRNCGAAALLAPWRRHNAGVV